MSGTLFSVIINNYNYAKYLKEAIDSALKQTYENKELIVVDDGSEDESREIIKSYGENIIAIFKENGGQASAMNMGYGICKGEWISFLDSDDLWLPERIEKVMNKINENPKAVLIYHRVKYISSLGEPFGKPIPKKLSRGNIEKIVLRSGGWWMFPPTSALSFRRDFLEKVMDIPEDDFRICADAYLADLAPFFGEVEFIDEVLGFYRLHGANYWNREEKLKKEREAMFSYLKMYEKRVFFLNKTLQRLGIEREVSLEKNWAYQRLRLLLGMETSIFNLFSIAYAFPYHTNFIEKLRAIAWILKVKFTKGGIKN